MGIGQQRPIDANANANANTHALVLIISGGCANRWHDRPAGQPRRRVRAYVMDPIGGRRSAAGRRRAGDHDAEN